MPQTTPIYGFPFPCPGETITAAAFTNLANAIDTKLLDLRTQESSALHRPRAEQSRLGFNVVVATDTTITGAGSTYVIPADGIYIVSVTYVIDSGFSPGASGGRAIIRQNGTNRFASVLHAPASGGSPKQTLSCPIIGITGDSITVVVRFEGTSGNLNFDMYLTARMIVRTA